MSEENSTGMTDPCGEFGPTQRAALVWFVAVLVIGVFLTCRLSGIDSWMYDNNAEMLDYDQYRENRRASSSIASEPTDLRSLGSYGATANNIK